MRVLVLLLLLAVAVADDAQRDLLEYTRLARGAAQGGDRDAARELGNRVRDPDPTFYANDFAADPMPLLSGAF